MSFQWSQLTSLEIFELIYREDGEANAQYLIDFLCTQTMLEELILDEVDFFGADVTEEHIEKMNFPLKRLSWIALNTVTKETHFMGGASNALAFLKRFASTLEHLVLADHFEPQFYALLFKKCQKLQSLEVCAVFLPEDENFYKTLCNLKSVKKLDVGRYTDGTQQFVEGIIGHLPNIETLIVSGIGANGLLKFVSNNLLKLKSLCIREITGNLFQDITMPQSLRKVDVESLNPQLSDQEWSQVLVAMPNVEQLTIHDTRDSLNEAKFDALTRSWTQLRVLNLGRDFKPTAQMFKDLLSRCPNIITVRCQGDSNDPAFKDFKKPGLRLTVNRDTSFEYLFDEKNPTTLNYY